MTAVARPSNSAGYLLHSRGRPHMRVRPYIIARRYSYARVSIGDQDVAGQSMRLTQAGAIKVFTDVCSGRTMDRPGLEQLESITKRGQDRCWPVS